MSDIRIGTPKLPPLPLTPNQVNPNQTHPVQETETNTPPTTPRDNTLQAKPTDSTETLQNIENNHSEPQELQNRSQDLGGLKQSLALSIGVVVNQPVNQPVDTTPPPQYSPQDLQSKLNQHLKQHTSFTDFTEAQQQREQSSETLFKTQKQLNNVDHVLEDILKGLDKREKSYNAPLYRLGSQLGIKSRKVKLAQLEILRQSALKGNEAMRKFNQELSNQDTQKLEQLDTQVKDHINKAKQDGAGLVNSMLGDKGMMWNLSTQSKSQLRETLAQVMVKELPEGQQLLDKYNQLSQDYMQAKGNFTELQAQVKLYQNRISNFNQQLRDLEQENPEMAQQLKDRFTQERVAFDQKLFSLVERVCPPEDLHKALVKDEQGNTRLNPKYILGHVHFNDKPPKLVDVLSEEHQNYIDNMATGIQETLPNKVLDDTSLMINGEKYSNKTFLAEAGFAKIYTYTSESDPTKKIVVKVPHKPENMSDDEFQEKLQTESATELQNHYHAMGVDGNGHTNLVKLIGAIPTEKGPLIAMEFVDNGNCNDFINPITGKMSERLKNNEITQDEYSLVNKHVLYQMMQGMQYMQDRGMTHLDVKYDNFLIQSDGTVKVADLGLSKTQAQFRLLSEERGNNPFFLPPEVMGNNLKIFEGGRGVSNQLDIWSVGIMGHEMLLGHRNRLDSNFVAGYEENLVEFGSNQSNKMFPNPQNPTEVFLNKMLHADPNQRSSFKHLMEDPVFDELFAPGVNGGRGEYRSEVTDLVKRELAK